MRHLTSILSAIALGITLTACASRTSGLSSEQKEMTTIMVSIPNYHGINASCGIDVIYTQNELTPAKVEAPAFVTDYLKIRVKNGTLDITLDQDFFKKYNGISQDVTVTVSAPAVNILEASSGASITVNGPFNIKGNAEFEASSGARLSVPDGFSGTGKIEMEASSGASVTAGNSKGSGCTIEASSGAGIELESITADKLGIDASSAARIKIGTAMTRSAIADLSSGSECRIAGKTGKLSVEATSGASFKGSDFISDTAIIEASSGGSVDYNSEKTSTDTGVTGSAKNHR